MLAMTTISSFTPSDTNANRRDQSATARAVFQHQVQPQASGSERLTPASRVELGARPPATAQAANPIYNVPKSITPASTILLDRLADSNAEVTRLLRRQPDFQAVTAAAFQQALTQAFPDISAPLNPDYVYVTTYNETGHAATPAAQGSHFERTTLSSQTLTQALQTALDSGTSPTYNQSRTGFFYLPNNASSSNEVAAMRGSRHLLTFERILQDAVGASMRPNNYEQGLQDFWNAPDDSFDPPQTPKAWLSAEYRMQRQTEAQLRVTDGTLTETSRQWLLHAANVANVAELQTSASKPGMFTLSLEDRAGAIPFSGIAVFTRSPHEAPNTTSGPVLLMIPGQGLMEFRSSSSYREALQQCFDEPALRTTLLTHVALEDRNRAETFGNTLDVSSEFRYRPVSGPLFVDLLQSQITQQVRDIVAATRDEVQQDFLPGTSADRVANLQNRFDVSGITNARQQLLYQRLLRQTVAHDQEIDRFTSSLAASIPLSPAAYADQLIQQRWGEHIDPRHTRLLTLHYDYAGHEAAQDQPKQGNVAHALSLTNALLTNYQAVGDNRVGENAFGLYTPARIGPTVETSNTANRFPADLGHYTYEGVYRQTQSSRYDPSNQISEISPADFKKWIWELDFKEKYRAYLQTVWPADAAINAASANNQRTLVKTAFVKTAFLQQAENTLSTAGLKLALEAAGLDAHQRWNDITPQQLQNSTRPASNIVVAPLAIHGYAATDILSVRDRDSHRILLYIPGNSSPLHEFDNSASLQTWLAAEVRDLAKREVLLTHFKTADLEDGGPFIWNKSGVKSALDGIAAYPKMRSVDQQKYAGAIYPHHRPGSDEVWNPAHYVQFPALATDQDPFAHLVLGIKQSTLAMVDEKIRDKSDVRWDNVNWYVKSTIKLAQSPLVLPLMMEFPVTFALLGLVDAGYGVNQALNGTTAEQRKAGATRAAFGLFNAIPFVAYGAQAFKTGSVAAQALDNAGNAVGREAALTSAATTTGDIADDFHATASIEMMPNRLRPSMAGTISNHAVPESSVAGIRHDANGIYQNGDRWYIRYTDASGNNVPYEIRSDFRIADRRVQIVDPATRQPVLTVDASGDGCWRRVSGTGGMPRQNKLKQLQQAKEAEAAQMNQHNETWATAYGRIADTLQGPALQTHMLGISGSVVVKANVRMELLAIMAADNKATRLNFSDFASNSSLLRERIESRIEEMGTISRNYRSAIETYEALKDADTNGYRRMIKMVRGEDPATQPQTQMSAVKRMIEAESAIIREASALHALTESELDRLLTKLDTLPVSASENAPSVATPQTSAKAGSSRATTNISTLSAKPVVPRNRVDICTVEGQVLSGKPRADNADIVDILDSRNQRKATYLRSPNEEYWIAYAPIQPVTVVGQTANVDAAAWNQLNNKFKKVLDEGKSAESIADFLARKGDGLPSTPAGILDHSANRLKETANEIQVLKSRLTTDENRLQADTMITSLRNKARELSNKGQGIRVTMMLNNPPTANDLEYLANRGLLQIRKTQSRMPMDRNVVVAPAARPQRVRDYLDEFEIRASGKVWAYAHLHYPSADTAAENFVVAHLKKPEQRYVGANAQSEAEAQGRRLSIHRGELYGPLVRKIFLSEMPVSSTSTASSTSSF